MVWRLKFDLFANEEEQICHWPKLVMNSFEMAGEISLGDKVELKIIATILLFLVEWNQ